MSNSKLNSSQYAVIFFILAILAVGVGACTGAGECFAFSVVFLIISVVLMVWKSISMKVLGVCLFIVGSIFLLAKIGVDVSGLITGLIIVGLAIWLAKLNDHVALHEIVKECCRNNKPKYEGCIGCPNKGCQFKGSSHWDR